MARSTNSVTASEVAPPSTSRGRTGDRRLTRRAARGSRRGGEDPRPPGRGRGSFESAAAAAPTRRARSCRRRASSCRPARASATVSRSGASALRRDARAPCAIAAGTASGRADRGELDQPHAVGELARRPRLPTSRASRVLPTPPTPLRVTTWWERSRAATSDSSRSRPIRVVADRGRLPCPALRSIRSVWQRRRPRVPERESPPSTAGAVGPVDQRRPSAGARTNPPVTRRACRA